MTNAQLLVRRFKIGATLLDDPDPDLSPQQVLDLYAANYPFLAGCTVDEGAPDGDVLVYRPRKPEVTTKGGVSVQDAPFQVGAAVRYLGPRRVAVADDGLRRLETGAVVRVVAAYCAVPAAHEALLRASDGYSVVATPLGLIPIEPTSAWWEAE